MIAIEKITIEVGDTKLSLSLEEARQLKTVLNDMLSETYYYSWPYWVGHWQVASGGNDASDCTITWGSAS
jgi:hypothetical protein